MNTHDSTNKVARFKLGVLSLAVCAAAQAQDDEQPGGPLDSSAQPSAQPTTVTAPPVMEEVVVTGGRLMSGAEKLGVERQEQAVAADFIGADEIGRIGDSTVAIALTRVPGVTLVDEKFVFVRGLGERYSSTRLNGAMVPSPDLSRNVLPLDLFPTSIVESLAIQKAPSADKPAAFGGGSVDIRTTGIPDDFLFSVELGSGINTESSDFLTYTGGDDDRWGDDDGSRALPNDINTALDTYYGDFTPSHIRQSTGGTLEQAQAENRDLIVALNRDISLRETSGEPDLEGEINLGNNFYLDNGMELGFLAGAAYDSQWRNNDITQRRLSDPENRVLFEDESVFSVSMTGNLSFGLSLNAENQIETTSLFLRDTDDEVSRVDYFNANNLLSDGRGHRNDNIRYEQRELEVHQVRGEHELGRDTIGALNLDALSFLEGLSLDWYLSDSVATTDIPGEIQVKSNITADPETGAALSSEVARNNASAASYRFTKLRDDVDANGFTVTMPIDWQNFDVELKGGSDYWQKARTYEQLEFFVGSTTSGSDTSIYQGELGEVFSDENMLDPDNGFLIKTNQGNANSYIAANKVNAGFGSIDVTWDETLRLVVGSRWEDYQQVNLPWDPISYNDSQFPGMDEDGYFQDVTYADDDFYNSVAATWMLQDFWAEDFQLRFSFSETTVRPDLREISSSSYFDPLTDILVEGNPEVVPSDVDNFDVRGEWYFSNGDHFTVSLFHKDIINPIELFEGAATDDNITAEIHNAEKASLTGLEAEFLKSLGDFSSVLDPFFVQGNLTVMDQDLTAGDRADAPTNAKRPLQGASDQVANLMLGYDSVSGQHAATLAYNVFSERLFFAGRNGAPDSYEQPFHSLNFTYSFYPTDNFTVKFKARNLLDEDLTIQADRSLGGGGYESVDLYKKEVGQDIKLSFQYRF